VLRAPGYPLFVAGVLALALEKPGGVSHEYMVRGASAIYAAQAVLMALAGMLLFLWLSDFVSRGTAFSAGLLMATNPYAVTLVGLVHYSVLHLFLLVAGCLALHRMLSTDAPRRGAALAAGLVWGCATLVRSTTLILPPFVLLLLLLRTRSLRRSFSAALVFTAGMGLAIAPVAIRNYRVSHRFVPVNLQAAAVLWGSTVKPLPIDPDSYRWYEIGDELVRVMAPVTGEPGYSYEAFVRHHLRLEDEFAKEALKNIELHPAVYLGNSLRNFVSFLRDTSSILIRVFGYSQPPRPWVDAMWFRRGTPRGFLPVQPAAAYAQLGAALTVLAALGLALALARHDTLALAPAAVFLCLASAHAVTHMDLLFYYQRLPFVAFFAFYGIHVLGSAVPAARRPARLAAGLLCAASLLLTLQLLAA
jgi:hypothetical protein